MKIMVTGAAGYIGSVLCRELLSAGYEVLAVDSLIYGGGSALVSLVSEDRFRFQRADIRDAAAMRESLRGVDAVVHLAAIVGDPACRNYPDLARSVNVGGSIHLLHLCREAQVKRFVFASTCSNYGRTADPSAYLTEDAELHPLSLYAKTKVAIEELLLDPATDLGFAPCVLRFATIFGVSPRMRFDLIVNQFTMELLTSGKVLVFGEEFWRPFVHVRDVARAIVTVLGAPVEQIRRRVFNVGDSSQNYQKRAVAELIRSTVAGSAAIQYVHMAEDPRNYRVAFERITHELGFRISRTVADGIQEVAQAIRDGIITDFGSGVTA